MKKIVLIDDNINRVIEIFGKIYNKLWKEKDEEGIASEVIFFGDQFKKRKEDSELRQENVDSVIRKIKNLLRLHCTDKEQWDNDGEMYVDKKKLINDVAKKIDIAADDDVEKLVQIWRSAEKINSEGSLADLDFGPLVKYILEGNNEIGKGDMYILLDVILLFDDIKQIGEEVPIISMGLYYALKKMGYNCYLYSSYAYDYLLMESYKKIYQNWYGQSIDVFHSNDFFSKEAYSKNCLFYYLNGEG